MAEDRPAPGRREGAGEAVSHVEAVVRQENGELAEDVVEVVVVEDEPGEPSRIVEARPVPPAPRRSHPAEPLPGSLEHDRSHPADR